MKVLELEANLLENLIDGSLYMIMVMIYMIYQHVEFKSGLY